MICEAYDGGSSPRLDGVPFLDDVPVEDVARFEEEFLDSVQRNHKGIYDAISGHFSADALANAMRNVPYAPDV